MTVSQSWGAPILVAEDDLLIGELVMLHLNAAGHQTAWVKSGRDVMSRVYAIRPRLLVLDIGLPVVSGFDILAEIRRQPVFAKLPILVLTARHAPGDVKRALTLGASDYVAKPFEVGLLMKRVERLLAPRPQKPVAKAPAPDDRNAIIL